MMSITKTLTLSLSLAAAVVYLVALTIVIWTSTARKPTLARCEAAAEILTRAVAIDSGRSLAVQPIEDLQEIQAQSPELWYAVSYAGQVVEYARERRPELPFVLPYAGPSGRAAFEAINHKNFFCLDATQQGGSQLVIVSSGAHLDFRQILKSLVRRDLFPITLVACAFVLIVAAGIMLSARLVARSIERVTKLALAIEPTSPKASISLKNVPRELVALASALNRAFEEIAAYMKRQRRFVGNAAHELRTPLLLLRAKIEEVPDPAIKAELIGDLRRLTSLVSVMLDLARLQNHKIDKGSVDLTAVTREVLADFGPSALDAGVELSLEQDGPKHIFVEAVEAAIRSVLGNLVGNALMHAQGATRIMVYLKQGSVTITDNGIGLPAGQGRDLIEPFQKGQGSQGAGLGLAIVQEIMFAHGGLMSIASTPGQGTAVHLRFEQVAVRQHLSEFS